uniref:Uncharacterized protein n=1 Tax=Macrostomum lignano TaxID=282301 RepID=A0A1I8F7X7_9PLAT
MPEWAVIILQRRPRPRPLRRRVAAGFPPGLAPGISQAWQSLVAHETQWCSTHLRPGRPLPPPPRCVDMNDPKAGRHQLGLLPGRARKPARSACPAGHYVICPQNRPAGAKWGASGPTASSTPPRKAVKTAERRQRRLPRRSRGSAARTDAAKVEQAACASHSWRRMRREQHRRPEVGRAMPARGNALELEGTVASGRTRHQSSPLRQTQARRTQRPPHGGGGSHGRLQRRRTASVLAARLTPTFLANGQMLAQDLTRDAQPAVLRELRSPATLDCANEAYSLALSSVKPYQAPADQLARWNNVSVIALQTRLQVRSFGTQLTIDRWRCGQGRAVRPANAAVNEGGGGFGGTRTGCQKREHLNWQTGTRGTGPWRCPTRTPGAWECYLVLDSRNQWKTNEFQAVNLQSSCSSLQKFNDAYLA